MSESLPTAPALVMPLPWHQPLWQQLARTHEAGRLPHALILHGAAGLGKFAFARYLAQSLMCATPHAQQQACGHCASCLLFAANTHPDLTVVVPEEDKQQISVDQIRSATERLGMTSSRQGYRIAIIDPAHQMTVAAANSLLKTLEEPGQQSLLILVTVQLSALLPTIRSRCQQMAMATPEPAVAREWLRQYSAQPVSDDLLQFTHGAPLRALAWAQGSFESLRQSMEPGVLALADGSADLAQLAGQWADERLVDRLTWLDGWLARRIRQEIIGIADPVTRDARQSSAQVLNINNLFQALDKLRELKAQLRRTALQRELALDVLLLMLQRALQTKT